MSEGFAAAWLDRREPVDARSRDATLQARLEAWCAGRDGLRVVDLGAGTGANLRRMPPELAARQSWTLAERDPALVAAGAARLAGSPPCWCYLELDLASDLERLEAERPRLITASALLDLAGTGWLRRLVALRARLGAALHVALSYDGRMAWRPPDPEDAACLALVNRHQRTDKGFGGPALGPEAAPVLRRLLAPEPGELLLARGDWRLGPADAVLAAELLEGHVAAAAAVAPDRGEAIAAWGGRRAARLGEPGACVLVGHLDLLFLPEPG